MTRWQYMTLMYDLADKRRSCWVVLPPDLTSERKQVGQAEKRRFFGMPWQATRLLETALKELDAEGWELVSTSFSGIFGFYGTAVLRRQGSENSPNGDS